MIQMAESGAVWPVKAGIKGLGHPDGVSYHRHGDGAWWLQMLVTRETGTRAH